MTQLLASVRDSHEAETALSAPIGILDLKEPTRGALGALPSDSIKKIVALTNKRCPVSATVGDLPPDADIAAKIIEQWIDCDVDYIKLGFFNDHYLETYPAMLKKYAAKTKLIAVLFADRITHLEGPCRLLATAGCAGIMLDTADKSIASIRTLLDKKALATFINTVHDLSLLCGIAGSLKKEDIAPLVRLAPDYLGFRTALCENQERNESISLSALEDLLATLKVARQDQSLKAHALTA